MRSARKHVQSQRLNLKDQEFQARRILEPNPKIENKILADDFGVHNDTVSDWVRAIRARSACYASRDALIYRLSLLG
jgi:hypothetical protein